MNSVSIRKLGTADHLRFAGRGWLLCEVCAKRKPSVRKYRMCGLLTALCTLCHRLYSHLEDER